MLQTREADAPDVGLRTLPRIPVQPETGAAASRSSGRPPLTATDRRGPWVPHYGQHALPHPPRSAPGLCLLCSATLQPCAGRTGRKILTTAPGRLPMREMSRGTGDQHRKCCFLGKTSATWGAQHDCSQGRCSCKHSRHKPTASLPCPSAAEMRKGPG